MNPSLDPEKENALLEALLRDDTWQATDRALKAGALVAFQRRQRQRRLTRMGAVALLVAAAFVSVALLSWPRRAVITPPQFAAQQNPPPPKSGAVRQLSDAELLAMFPKGSCLLAEVDGRKELVFLDPKAERLYLARSPQPGR
jgi:hypothetical protein